MQEQTSVGVLKCPFEIFKDIFSPNKFTFWFRDTCLVATEYLPYTSDLPIVLTFRSVILVPYSFIDFDKTAVFFSDAVDTWVFHRLKIVFLTTVDKWFYFCLFTAGQCWWTSGSGAKRTGRQVVSCRGKCSGMLILVIPMKFCHLFIAVQFSLSINFLRLRNILRTKLLRKNDNRLSINSISIFVITKFRLVEISLKWKRKWGSCCWYIFSDKPTSDLWQKYQSAQAIMIFTLPITVVIDDVSNGLNDTIGVDVPVCTLPSRVLSWSETLHVTHICLFTFVQFYK